MAITRKALLNLLATYGDNNFDNIEYIVTTHSDTIRMDWYRTPGCGVRWVDEDLLDGEYRTGVELYGPIPHSMESGLDENGAKVVSFIDIEMVDRIAFKTSKVPDWAWKAETNANLKSLELNGKPLTGFNANVLEYNVKLPKGTTTAPFATVTTESVKSKAKIAQAVSVTGGSAKIVVTAEDGTTTKTYKITFTVAE